MRGSNRMRVWMGVVVVLTLIGGLAPAGGCARARMREAQGKVQDMEERIDDLEREQASLRSDLEKAEAELAAMKKGE